MQMGLVEVSAGCSCGRQEGGWGGLGRGRRTPARTPTEPVLTGRWRLLWPPLGPKADRPLVLIVAGFGFRQAGAWHSARDSP